MRAVITVVGSDKIGNLTKMNVEFQEIVDAYEKLGEELGLSIRVQHQGIFDKMHQI